MQYPSAAVCPVLLSLPQKTKAEDIDARSLVQNAVRVCFRAELESSQNLVLWSDHVSFFFSFQYKILRQKISFQNSRTAVTEQLKALSERNQVISVCSIRRGPEYGSFERFV